jgi:hypothetical protein
MKILEAFSEQLGEKSPRGLVSNFLQNKSLGEHQNERNV